MSDEQKDETAQIDECPSGGAHYWLLRPETDTHECAFCGGEQ